MFSAWLNNFAPEIFYCCQFEIPLAVVMAAAKAAKEKSVTVIVDPAPAQANLPRPVFSAGEYSDP